MRTNLLKKMPQEPDVADREMEILRHALGKETEGVFLRNHFATDEGTDDYPVCEELVSKGLMVRHERSWCPGFIYVATRAGVEAKKTTIV